jgi:glycosyltransferase involved in cell wall biosynthesis
MKIVHVPFCFRPDAVGGTEVYVESLAAEQARRGVDVVVAAPSRAERQYVLDGLRVRRFRTSDSLDLCALYGGGDPVARTALAELVDEEQPDIVHLHAFTSAVSAMVASDVRLREIPMVFTYHTPTASCQRGTLLRWGVEVCDGRLDVHTCASCTLNGLGQTRTRSLVLGSTPPVLGSAIGRLGLTGGVWTAARMTDLVRRQQRAFHSFMHAMDRIVVLCEWSAQLLIKNGIPRRKLVLSRHGLPPSTRRARSHATGALRVAYLGRVHPTKGPDTLIRAVRARPTAPIQLDMYGVLQDDPSTDYVHHVYDLASGDPRIRLLDPVPSGRVIEVLADYDVLAVPSRWLETGPLVVLEAFAAGIPVVGSNLGGIAELVTPGVDGVLVEPDSVAAWADVLAELACKRSELERLSHGIRTPRTIQEVADDMQRMYHQLVPGTVVSA